MNNVTLGNDRFTYYETIGGGQGACPDADGPSAVHVTMSNTLTTPVEALELVVSAARRALRAAARQRRSRRAPRRRRRRARAARARGLPPLDPQRAPHCARRAAPTAARTAHRGRNLLNGRELPPKVTTELRAGDVVTIETPGGGGHGG